MSWRDGEPAANAMALSDAGMVRGGLGRIMVSDVRILKFLVRVYPRTSTKDPRPRLCPQADAVSDPLSVRESAARLLTHQQLCAVW